MQKIIFGIFAHPDDEAFGPCATLLQETDSGSELHLILLTAGDGIHSANPDNVTDLGQARLEEWQKSAELLGAQSTHHLGHSDGKLNNDTLLEIVPTLQEIVTSTVAGRTDIEIELLTFDLNGLTGHIDHVVAAQSAGIAYYRLKAAGLPVKRLRLYCLSEQDYPEIDTSFVFRESGRPTSMISETIDGRPLFERVKQVMECHTSQRSDREAQLAQLGDKASVDHFLVLE